MLLAASVSDGTALTVSWFSWGLDERECGTIAEEEGTESLLLFKIISQLAEEYFVRASGRVKAATGVGDASFDLLIVVNP